MTLLAQWPSLTRKRSVRRIRVILGSLKPNSSWQCLTIFISVELNKIIYNKIKGRYLQMHGGPSIKYLVGHCSPGPPCWTKRDVPPIKTHPTALVCLQCENLTLSRNFAHIALTMMTMMTMMIIKNESYRQHSCIL